MTERRFIFRGAEALNQDTSGWKTAQVETMGEMFMNAKAFNRDISEWDTSKVTNMVNMFKDADAFNANQKITASCENNKCTLTKA